MIAHHLGALRNFKEPLGAEALLKGVHCWGRAFRLYSLALLPVCSLLPDC